MFQLAVVVIAYMWAISYLDEEQLKCDTSKRLIYGILKPATLCVVAN